MSGELNLGQEVEVAWETGGIALTRGEQWTYATVDSAGRRKRRGLTKSRHDHVDRHRLLPGRVDGRV